VEHSTILSENFWQHELFCKSPYNSPTKELSTFYVLNTRTGSSST